ncbi:uncharacterized protein LOC111392986 [Olea europaea var. sylvestris]|uniref:uncharacterized protein LOC111392986 n=1 Tax=Olea europaea var. sylvestris TaxID=158386 RepID=UPI000C1CDA56|nr:uncharacterized protein LOC111392986 [Olea europaea var. sylvestris]
MADAFRSSIPNPTFNGDNYDFWSIKMKTYFCAQNLWDVVNDGYINPDDISTLSTAQKKEIKENQQKDSLALLALQMSLTGTYFTRIMGAKTAKEAWDKLKEEFHNSDEVHTYRLQTLRRNFENLKMKYFETTKDYYSRLNEIVKQLITYGEDVPQKKVVENFLITCTEKYDPIIATIEDSKDIDKLTAAELMGSLEVHEKRLERRYEIHTKNVSQKVGEQMLSNPMEIYNNAEMMAQVDESWQWHKRFGHFHFHELKILQQTSMMRDLPVIKEIDAFRERCLLGKQYRQPFSSKKSWRAKKPLELTHIEICSPIRTPSHEQNRYFIFFIDDYSRMTWVYILRENPKSDRGKEYASNEFNKFCEDEGLEHQLTVGYALEQNGVSKRKNGTMIEIVRAMLMEKSLPKTFWAEAFDEDVTYNWETGQVEKKTISILTQPQNQEGDVDENNQPESPQQATIEKPVDSPELSPRKTRRLLKYIKATT